MSTDLTEAGGFLNDAILSPASTSHSVLSISLPRPRSQPLRTGSSKEEAARRYVDSRLLYVSRRYTKKFQSPEADDEVVGYRNIYNVCNDLGEIVDVLWLSGTPSLQIPYLLNIVLSFSTYLSAFPADPIPTFTFLRKLDYAFTSLLRGYDVDSGDPLPGIQGKRGGMSKTDMVRCKSLVERMRVQIVEVMSGERASDLYDSPISHSGEQAGTDRETDTVYTDNESICDFDNDRGHEMDVARVFEKTVVQLGESLRGSNDYDVGD